MRDAVATMGSILPDDVGGRDAVHVAVIAATAPVKLVPGQDVGYFDGGALLTDPLGIVDPFLKVAVQPGQRFWLYLYPRTITGLNHHWSHPALDAPKPTDPKAEAEKWMRQFAENADISYRDAIDAGREFVETGEYFVQRDRESARNLIFEGDNKAIYWKNFQIITGIEVPEETRDGYVFSCSC